jgi:predicted RNA-binding Zn-ribbon protein involved in translation (DUF1610 family)
MIKAKKGIPTEPVIVPPVAKYKYLCPACTNVAIQSSNKMLGVEVECNYCGKLIKLEDEGRYIELA